MQKMYAQALVNLSLQEGANKKALVEKLIQHLHESGRTKLLPKILRELKIHEARSEKKGSHIEVATQADAHEAQTEAARQGIVGAKAHVNHDLIRGWRAKNDSVLIDHSAKQGLIDLYRAITK